MASAPPTGPVLGPDGQRCPQCGELLRADQRYCLNCGRRRAEMRLPFLEIVGPHGPAAPAAAAIAVPPLATPAAERSPLVALGLLVALLLALGIGVLVGRGARGPEVVARAPVVNVAAAPAGGAATTAGAPVVSEWPAGKDGWTIELRTLPSTATADEAAKAKQDATTAGATAVGLLRSDEFPSLTAGQIVIYSGIYDKKTAAKKALPALAASFPGAKVVRVAATARAASSSGAATGASPLTTTPKKSSNLSPEEYQKKSKKLPDEVQSQGTAPPKDNQAPGGGTGEVTEIG